MTQNTSIEGDIYIYTLTEKQQDKLEKSSIVNWSQKTKKNVCIDGVFTVCFSVEIETRDLER